MEHATNVFKAFDARSFIFQNNMWVEFVKVIKCFLKILKVYDLH
jgi:hypothetical protein